MARVGTEVERVVSGTWRMHGIDIRSAWRLPGARAIAPTADAWTIAAGDGARPVVLSSAASVMRDESAGRVQAEAFAVDSGLVFRAPTVCTATVDLDARLVHVWPEDPQRGVFIPLVLQGALAALLIDVAGDVAMHASAVEHRGAALLFAGVSGQGKSTTAVMAVEGGARFFSDDVVRVAADDNGRSLGYRGTVEARLRPAAAEVGRSVGGSVRATSDGRTAVTLDGDSGPDVLPVGAVVLPRPDRAAVRCDVTVLAEDQAFLELHRCLRLPGWSDPAVRMRRFDALALLAARVPVLLARIPWQLPFAAGAGRELLDGIDVATGAPAAVVVGRREFDR